MLNIDIDNIKKKDMVYIHALMLTLKHFRYLNSYLSLVCDDDKYYVYGFNNCIPFDDINSACQYVLSLVSFDSNETKKVMDFYGKMLSAQFNDMEALEYIEYYLDESYAIRERSRK